MDKKWTCVASVSVAIVIVLIVTLVVSSPTFGYSKKILSASDFKDIPPIILRTEDGKQYKFDIDILQDFAHATGEPSTVVNHQANGDIVKLKRGEKITITYGSPFGLIDFVKGSLLKGRVVTYERWNENVNVVGIQSVFLQDIAPQGSSHAQIPPTIRTGPYNLVILITYNEEIRGYYITNAIVN